MADADAEDDEGKKHIGLLVGPAMGRVGAQVLDSVTTRLWPSQPVEDSRSDISQVSLSASQSRINE